MDPTALANFQIFPLSPPPAGVRPNFTDPVSRAPAVYISAAICIPLILFFATLRFYAKLTFMKGKVWNDG
jgi:hypothetical protein